MGLWGARPVLFLVLLWCLGESWGRVTESSKQDVATISLQGFVWSFLSSFPPHQHWDRTLNFQHWHMSEQKENTSISYQKDFAQRHVQTNNVGYIYLFLDLLIFFCTNSNRQLNHEYFRIQGLGLYCWNEGSTGKIPELNLSSCFRIVCLYSFKPPNNRTL